MASHYTWGSVATLHDVGGVLGQPLHTFLWALTISWSRLLAHVWSGPECVLIVVGWKGQVRDYGHNHWMGSIRWNDVDVVLATWAFFNFKNPTLIPAGRPIDVASTSQLSRPNIQLASSLIVMPAWRQCMYICMYVFKQPYIHTHTHTHTHTYIYIYIYIYIHIRIHITWLGVHGIYVNSFIVGEGVLVFF
jgi:hypothetical protein